VLKVQVDRSWPLAWMYERGDVIAIGILHDSISAGQDGQSGPERGQQPRHETQAGE
jgi:hypothetical protein